MRAAAAAVETGTPGQESALKPSGLVVWGGGGGGEGGAGVASAVPAHLAAAFWHDGVLWWRVVWCCVVAVSQTSFCAHCSSPFCAPAAVSPAHVPCTHTHTQQGFKTAIEQLWWNRIRTPETIRSLLQLVYARPSAVRLGCSTARARVHRSYLKPT